MDSPPSAWHGQSLEREPLFLGKVLGVQVTRGGGVIPHISEEGGSTLALAPLPCLLMGRIRQPGPRGRQGAAHPPADHWSCSR